MKPAMSAAGTKADENAGSISPLKNKLFFSEKQRHERYGN